MKPVSVKRFSVTGYPAQKPSREMFNFLEPKTIRLTYRLNRNIWLRTAVTLQVSILCFIVFSVHPGKNKHARMQIIGMINESIYGMNVIIIRLYMEYMTFQI